MLTRLKKATQGTEQLLAADAKIICLADGNELLPALAALPADRLPACTLLDIWMPLSDGMLCWMCLPL